MIKRTWLLLVTSSVLLVSACTPTGEATEEVIDSEVSEESESESAVSSERATSTESEPAEEKNRLYLTMVIH